MRRLTLLALASLSITSGVAHAQYVSPEELAADKKSCAIGRSLAAHHIKSPDFHGDLTAEDCFVHFKPTPLLAAQHKAWEEANKAEAAKAKKHPTPTQIAQYEAAKAAYYATIADTYKYADETEARARMDQATSNLAMSLARLPPN